MDNYFEQIQDYLDGTLTTEEQRQFESELAKNTALFAETEHQRTLRDTIRKHLDAEEKLAALKQSLTRVGGEYAAEQQRKGRGGRLIRWVAPLAVAASLIMAMNLLGWFATDFERLPEMPTQVTRGQTSPTPDEAAAEAFNNAGYNRSTELLESLVNADTTVARNRYFLGLSYLGEKAYERAWITLAPVADGVSIFAEDARYFAAVALWRLDKKKEALAYAERVSKTSSYHKKATALRRKLK